MADLKELAKSYYTSIRITRKDWIRIKHLQTELFNARFEQAQEAGIDTDVYEVPLPTLDEVVHILLNRFEAD